MYLAKRSKFHFFDFLVFFLVLVMYKMSYCACGIKDSWLWDKLLIKNNKTSKEDLLFRTIYVFIRLVMTEDNIMVLYENIIEYYSWEFVIFHCNHLGNHCYYNNVLTMKFWYDKLTIFNFNFMLTRSIAYLILNSHTEFLRSYMVWTVCWWFLTTCLLMVLNLNI